MVDCDKVVMAVKKKGLDHTVIWFDRQLSPQGIDYLRHYPTVLYSARNIEVRAGAGAGDSGEPVVQWHVALQFKVSITDASKDDGLVTLETRTLRFYFRKTRALCNGSPEDILKNRQYIAQEYFKVLMSPANFPSDYAGFIKKVMQTMKHFFMIMRMELDIRKSGERVPPIQLDSAAGVLGMDDEAAGPSELEPVTRERVLDLVERAFPYSITVDDILDMTGSSDAESVLDKLNVLRHQRIVRLVEDTGAYTRALRNEADVQLVGQMPKVPMADQPTVAVITALYSEKLAVDAMLERTRTFVQGESSVYTIGVCGSHRVVTTKLPQVGQGRDAEIAAGSTTTRLLGTFQNVEYVILVGVAGGPPHLASPQRSLRRGDVLVSHGVPMYFACEPMGGDPTDRSRPNSMTGLYDPGDTTLQDAALRLKEEETPDKNPEWWGYIDAAMSTLAAEHTEFARPADDKIYMHIGGDSVIEVVHQPDHGVPAGGPRLHLGRLASGRTILDPEAREKFVKEADVRGFDTEFVPVMKSILGNRKEAFALVRGVADYGDGQKGKQWQPYAALAAAAVMKAIILRVPPPKLDILPSPGVDGNPPAVPPGSS